MKKPITIPQQKKSLPGWDSLWALWLAGALMVLAGWAAYANSFSGAFIFDDLTAVSHNPTIQHLWPLSTVFSPPQHGETVSGRPILNLSFALNYAWGGTRVGGYHVTNLIIHLLNGLLLLGILRRTFLLPALRPRFGRAALPLASVIALLWVVHPLQTESVTSVAQRAESLASLFYLLVLYAVMRGGSAGRSAWYGLAVAACWLGVATKEIVATAPVMVLLYDRTLWAGSFRQALRQRWVLYLGLAASWALLIGLITQRGFVTTALEHDGVPSVWAYARSQPGVLLYYLRMIICPYPLCLDHRWPVAQTWSAIGLPMLAVGFLLAATIWALFRNNIWGLLGAWFFLILAPSSSVVSLVQLACEHRTYLAMVPVLILLVLLVYWAGQRWLARSRLTAELCLVVLVSATFGFLTFQRNRDYSNMLSMWEDVANKVPENPLGHYNWGIALADIGRFSDAIKQYELAVQCDPNYADAQNNWGVALVNLKRGGEAIEHYRRAIEINPQHANAYNNLGTELLAQGRLAEAAVAFRQALGLQSDFFKPHYNLLVTLAQMGRIREAVEEGQRADHFCPNQPKLIALVAWLLATHDASDSGDPSLALQWAQRAMALTQGHDGECAESLAAAYAATGNFAQAVAIATRTQQAAQSAGLHALAARIERELSCYRAGKPYHDPPVQVARNRP